MREMVSRNHAGWDRFLDGKVDRAVSRMDAGLQLSDTLLRGAWSPRTLLRTLKL